MQDKVKVEVLDLTEDSDEEQNLKSEPLSPVKEIKNPSDSEPGESSGLQKSPSGRFIRNIDKCMDKAIAEIRKGQSLVAVALQYGIPQEVLYSKLVSRSLPREPDILTSAEENSLVKWIVKSNKNNTLIFKQQLMEKVGKLKKVMNITPIFAKSKFGRMWYEYFMKNHPEIYENDGLLMLSDRALVSSLSQDDLNKKQVSSPDPEDFDILTPDEEDSLVDWIITSNKNNSLIFKYQLMKRVGKLNKVSKSIPGFAKLKFGRMWYERFLKNHPEIYENDELLLPSENVLVKTSNQWPDEDDIKLARNTFKTSTDSATMAKHSATMLLSYGVKEAVVVLQDFRKEKNSPYRLNEKNVYVHQSIENVIDDLKKELNCLKSESSVEYLDTFKGDSPCEFEVESGIESDRCSSAEDRDVSYETDIHLKVRKRNSFGGRTPVCKKCAKSFCNLAKLKRHMLTIHQPKELHWLQCLQCNKRFASKYHLSVHMKEVHSSTYHECKDCGKHFRFKTSMRKHQRTVHEGLDNQTHIFFCDFCKKGFKYKNSLEAHIIYGHLKEKKPFSCNICEMSFVKHSLMLRHQTRHSKIKPMECIHCSKTFSRKYLLREHIKESHNISFYFVN